MSVLPPLHDPDMSSLDIHRTFTEQVSEPDTTSGGAYTVKQGGQIAGYALPISGQGFWAPIEGVIGIDADRKTITGIAFYEQKETPGLGAEIAQPAFQNQFKGKVFSSAEKPVTFRRPGEDVGPSEVHAVTGATQTSTRLEKIINESVRTWQSTMSGKGGAE